jgi:hypothetical protein
MEMRGNLQLWPIYAEGNQTLIGVVNKAVQQKAVFASAGNRTQVV